MVSIRFYEAASRAIKRIADNIMKRRRKKHVTYTGQPRTKIPRGVTHLDVDPSVQVIGDHTFSGHTNLVQVHLCDGLESIGFKAFARCENLASIILPSTVTQISRYAFWECYTLMDIILPEGLETIDDDAFYCCRSLENIRIPSTIKHIGESAFLGCEKLRKINLPEGLMTIGYNAFGYCRSLEYINIPSTVKCIDWFVFRNCTSLVTCQTNEGLEEITHAAFAGCRKLEFLVIPPTVKEIAPDAFIGCTSLREVVFCESLESFVSEASLRDWWDHGRKQSSLLLHNLLVHFRIPTRLSGVQPQIWRTNIYSMLDQIAQIDSSIPLRIGNRPAAFKSQIKSISSQLSCYENCFDCSTLLELALWKSKMAEEQTDLVDETHRIDMKLQHRNNCGATVIIPLVLSFLVNDKTEDDGDDDEGGS